MSFKKVVLAMFISMVSVASQSMAQGIFGDYVTFDWTQYSTNSSYRAQGSKASAPSFNQATYNVTYMLDGRAQSAQISVRRVQQGVVTFNFLNRRNNAVCPGSAQWGGDAFYGSMSCRSGEHPVTIYF